MKDASVIFKESALTRTSYSPSPWRDLYILSAGGILACAGANNVLDSFGKSQVLDLSDPLFGIPFRHFLFLIGTAEFFVCWLCLLTNKRILSLGLVAWLVGNFAIYRIVLWSMGWQHPWVFVGGLTDALNVSPFLADGILLAIGIYLLIGSVVTLWIEHRMAHADGFQKMACSSCGVRIRFTTENLGRQIACPHCKTTITLRKPEEMLKMSCFFCKEHIEFPIHALGRKIKCPHCKMEIGLKEESL